MSQCAPNFHPHSRSPASHVHRDIVDALRVVLHAEGDSAHERTPQEVFRYVNRLSAPVLRVLRAAQSMITRAANRAAQDQGAAASTTDRAVVAQPSTVHLLFPVLRGVLTLQGVLPNSEMAFAVLDRYSATCQVLSVVSQSSPPRTQSVA